MAFLVAFKQKNAIPKRNSGPTLYFLGFKVDLSKIGQNL